MNLKKMKINIFIILCYTFVVLSVISITPIKVISFSLNVPNTSKVVPQSTQAAKAEAKAKAAAKAAAEAKAAAKAAAEAAKAAAEAKAKAAEAAKAAAEAKAKAAAEAYSVKKVVAADSVKKAAKAAAEAYSVKKVAAAAARADSVKKVAAAAARADSVKKVAEIKILIDTNKDLELQLKEETKAKNAAYIIGIVSCIICIFLFFKRNQTLKINKDNVDEAKRLKGEVERLRRLNN